MSLENILATAFLASLTPEEREQLEKLGYEEVRTHLIKLLPDEGKKVADAPTVPSIHSKIRIPFVLGGQHFEAVGFLREGEQSCLGKQALERVSDPLKSEEDWRLLYEYRAQLPAELRKYWLVTTRPYPGSPRFVSLLYFGSRKWHIHWINLDVQWFSDGLVVRRCV
ncbi:MAG: hypothetical protein KIH62_001820 [Candidatus Kerfeldbacteria bacterium]|nr:hypothetical protein [Candidatus Kerfeldbacteria bacterium]